LVIANDTCVLPPGATVVGLKVTLCTTRSGPPGGIVVTDAVPLEQSLSAVWPEDRHTRTKIVSATNPGFIGTVIFEELSDLMALMLLVQTPAPGPKPHLN
jgi:hypothetical protein